MQKHNRKEKTKCIGRTSTGNQNAEGGKDVDVEIHQWTSKQETRSFNFWLIKSSAALQSRSMVACPLISSFLKAACCTCVAIFYYTWGRVNCWMDATNQAVLDSMSKHHMLSDITITGIQDIVNCERLAYKPASVKYMFNCWEDLDTLKKSMGRSVLHESKMALCFKGILNNKWWVNWMLLWFMP